MPFALLACFVEENYLHTVRRTINNFKKNIQDIKPNTLIKIKTLLENNKNLMVKTILDDIKTELYGIKFYLPKNYSSYYIRIELESSYYLTDILLGDRTLDEWEYSDPWTWGEIKKDLMKQFKHRLNNASVGFLYKCFEENITKYGKINRKTSWSLRCPLFTVRTEVWNIFDSEYTVRLADKLDSLIRC